ncbi:hypothetical protein LTS10_001904 [Elasticomyces elasticus]|nr:hypothetical protein LTS10_001904 [Elasticomyces elasticus]
MSVSGVSSIGSFDYDLEKAVYPFPDRAESPRINGAGLSWRNSTPRPHSRNYSRPSPPSSIGSVDHGHPVRRHRSSDDLAHMRRAQTPQDVPEMPGSPMTTQVPVFAKKAVHNSMLRDPPPIPPDTPPRIKQSRKSTGSMDVVEAAKRMPPSAWSSTRSLISMIREKADLEPTTFAQRVFEAGKPDLLYDLRTTKRMKDRRDGVLDLTTLQRMGQHVLQQKLVEQVKAVGDKGAWMEIGIRETLHDYCEAVRDLEYMEQCALRGTENDPFLISTKNPLQSKLLEESGLAFPDARKQLPQYAPDRLQYTKRQSRIKQSLRRLLMSLTGGLALIAPFLIMLLVDGQLIRLICACAFTVVFAIAIVVASELGPDTVGLSTAAYAAALIVFIANNPPTYWNA